MQDGKTETKKKQQRLERNWRSLEKKKLQIFQVCRWHQRHLQTQRALQCRLSHVKDYVTQRNINQVDGSHLNSSKKCFQRSDVKGWRNLSLQNILHRLAACNVCIWVYPWTQTHNGCRFHWEAINWLLITHKPASSYVSAFLTCGRHYLCLHFVQFQKFLRVSLHSCSFCIFCGAAVFSLM